MDPVAALFLLFLLFLLAWWRLETADRSDGHNGCISLAPPTSVIAYDDDNGWVLPPSEEWPDFDPVFADQALALLIISEDVVCLGADTGDGSMTAGLYVNCSDIFFWGCADFEPTPRSGFSEGQQQIIELYEMCKRPWGSARWCCLQRGMRPQKPVIDRMKEGGFWTDDLEALPERTDA